MTIGPDGRFLMPSDVGKLRSSLLTVIATFVDIRSAGYIDHSAHSRLVQALDDLEVKALACDGEMIKRRKSWATNPDFRARCQALRGFRPGHAMWPTEVSLTKDFMHVQALRRARRAGLKKLDKQASKTSQVCVFLDDVAPLSAAVRMIAVPRDYRFGRDGLPKGRRPTKRYAAGELRKLYAIAMLVSDCIEYHPETALQGSSEEGEEALASALFVVSYALATGAMLARWRVV